ncbi:hypothetical protein ACFL5V_13565 [Fibrobacterota bacterium]
MKYLCVCVVLLLLPAGPAAEEDGAVGRTKLIDLPATGLLPKAYYDMDVKFFFGGGIVLASNFGVNDRFNVGLGWGMGNLISQTDVDYYIPGVCVKFLAVKESYSLPGIPSAERL